MPLYIKVIPNYVTEIIRHLHLDFISRFWVTLMQLDRDTLEHVSLIPYENFVPINIITKLFKLVTDIYAREPAVTLKKHVTKYKHM